MQYYKVLKDRKVIDVLNCIRYVKYNKKHKRMFNADISDAEAILSSNGKYAWHINTLLEIPVDGYDTVELVPIDVYEYNNLKMMNGHTYDEIVDSVILSLVEGGII